MFTSKIISMASVDAHILIVAVDYYRSIKGNLQIPSGANFQLTSLPERVINYTSVIEVEEPGPTFRYSFWGAGLKEIVGSDLTGKSVHENPKQELAEMLHSAYCKVMQEKQPLLFEETLDMGHGTKFTTHALRLPLSSNGNELDRIVAVTNFSEKMPELNNVADNYFR